MSQAAEMSGATSRAVAATSTDAATGTVAAAGRHAVMAATAVAVRYGTAAAVRDVSLHLQPGETVALLGPSGSGKTTFLYAVAGFLPVAGGEISLAGTLVSSRSVSVAPERRPVGMVFQHYGLWPHMDALETVAYPLRRSGVERSVARDRARELLEQLHIGHLTGRKPAQLSGGEQQRVGLARALARRPVLYLLDEPTAHLDTALKSDLQAELAARMHADGAAAVHATHDVEEALAVADRVVLLRDGAVVQVGSPREVYARPTDEWAARLTGPAAFIDAEVAAEGTDGPGRYLVRPDWVRFDGPLEGSVEDVRYRGTHTDYRIATALGQLLLRAPGPPRVGRDDRVSCAVERVWRMPAAR